MNPVRRALLSGAAALLVLSGGALWVCPGACGAVPAFDAAGLAAARAWRGPIVDALAAGATWLGSLAVLAPLAMAIAWVDARNGGWRLAGFVPLALLAASVVARLAKLAVLRPRPDEFAPLAAMPADASFPSAHAMQISAVVLAFLLRPGARPGTAAWLGGLALISAVAASRVHLQLHFPSDVLFGVAAAALLVAALRSLPPWNRGVA